MSQLAKLVGLGFTATAIEKGKRTGTGQPNHALLGLGSFSASTRDPKIQQADRQLRICRKEFADVTN